MPLRPRPALALAALPLLLLWASSLRAQPQDAASPETPGRVSQAQTLLVRGEAQEAQRLLSRADTLSAQEHYWLGRAYQALFQYREATRAFARADTSDVRVLAAWGESLRRLGRTSEALRRYRQAHERDSTDRSVRLALVDLHAKADQWTEAKAHLEALVQAHPENPVLHAQLARAHQATDAAVPAIRHYERARKLNPSDLETPVRLARLYRTLDSLAAAGRVLAEATRHHPQSARLWVQRGQLAFQAARPDSAVIAFRSAVALGDSSTATLRGLGKGYYLMGRYPAALPLLRRAYAQDSTHAATAFFLGVIHNTQGRPDSALHYLDRAAEHFGRPTLANVYEQMADAYKQRGDYPDAIDADRTALALAPRKVALVFHLATLYDTYYADPGPARQHYRLFLRRTAPEAFPQMRAFAEYRLEHLDERQFFERPPATPASDSAE